MIPIDPIAGSPWLRLFGPPSPDELHLARLDEAIERRRQRNRRRNKAARKARKATRFARRLGK